MKIVYHYITPDTINKRIFSLLLKKEFHTFGVLEDVYIAPEQFIKEEAHLLLGYIKGKIVSMCFISKGEFYGWQYRYKSIKNSYGIIAFYTHPEHRRKGYATQLFDHFKEKVDIPKIILCSEAASMLKSVPKSRKFIIP